MSVLILMSTFEGEPFLEAQVHSLRAQTRADWRLLVRDDGSRDGTVPLLRALARQDGRIHLLEDALGNLGPAMGFSRLMEAALAEPAPMIAFADQDDVWHADKLARQIEALEATPPATPVLVHSDLALVAASGEGLGQTFMQRRGLRPPAGAGLRTLLLHNHIVGCSMLINRPLLRLATPVPQRAHMHDWWLGLCAAAGGEIRYLSEPLLDYRQHAGNRVGARGLGQVARRPAQWLGKMNRIYHTAFAQAAALDERLRAHPVPQQARARRAEVDETLSRFLALRRRGGPARVLGLRELRARCLHPALTALFYAQALALRPAPPPVPVQDP